MRRPTLLAVILFSSTVAVPAAARAQAKVTGPRGDFLASMAGVQRKFEMLADAFPQDKYDWRPGKGVRSVCEVFMHIAGENYEMGKAYGAAKAPPELADGKDACLSDKAEVKSALTASFAALRTAVLNTRDADLEGPFTLFGVALSRRQWLLNTAEHAGEHLGQTIAYARVNDIVPPWSK